jgi:hypothetical protein
MEAAIRDVVDMAAWVEATRGEPAIEEAVKDLPPGPANDFMREMVLVLMLMSEAKNDLGELLGLSRDYALDHGVDVINGLAITTDFADLDDYFESSLIGGENAFVLEVTTFGDFSQGIRDKLIREISNEPNSNAVPEPGTMWSIGIGALGLFGLARKYRK